MIPSNTCYVSLRLCLRLLNIRSNDTPSFQTKTYDTPNFETSTHEPPSFQTSFHNPLLHRQFIHSDHFYSASSSPLLPRGAPDTARILCREFVPKRHRQFLVKDLAARAGVEQMTLRTK